MSEDKREKVNQLVTEGLTTKKGFMDKYEEYVDRGMKMPNDETIQKMKENDISFDLYSKYKFDEDNMEEEQQKIKNTTLLLTGINISKDDELKDEYDIDDGAKIEILKDDKYTDEERDKLYSSIALGNGENADKARKYYQDFKSLGTGEPSEINSFFAWKQSGYTNKGKKPEVLAWLSSQDLTEEQILFLMSKKQYKLTTNQINLLKSRGVTLSKKYNK